MKPVTVILWCFCGAFALTGLAFLIAPGQIIDLCNYAGQIGNFEPIPPEEGRFWAVFAFAYMTLVTALAYMGARAPQNSRPVIRLLIVGKLSTSLTALALFFQTARAMGFLATFIIDGGITLILFWCLFRLDKYGTVSTAGRYQPAG